MVLFILDSHTFRVEKQTLCHDWDLIMDSLDLQKSTVTVTGATVSSLDIGEWGVLDGHVFLLDQLRPKGNLTIVSLKPALDYFSRPIPFVSPPEGTTTGQFLAAALLANWGSCPDPEYAAPYLEVSDFDTTPYIPPTVDAGGYWRIPDYVRSVRSSAGMNVRFSPGRNSLKVTISAAAPKTRVILFHDGKHHLHSSDFATPSVAKITAVQGGTATDWYLSADGQIYQSVPPERAAGVWNVINVPDSADVAAKVAEAFATSQTCSHKIEFSTERDYSVLDRCAIRIGSDVIQSAITLKRLRRGDPRWFYRAGTLATTATEKLKGVI